MKIKNKAQVWSLDLMIAIVIFLSGMIAIYLFAINYSSESADTLENLLYEGNLAANNLLSVGSPADWHLEPGLTTVYTPGILNEINKVDSEPNGKLAKLEEYLSGLTESKDIKRKLNINPKIEFCIIIEDSDLNFKLLYPNGICSSTPRCDEANNPENLVRITRFVVYENKPSKFILNVCK